MGFKSILIIITLLCALSALSQGSRHGEQRARHGPPPPPTRHGDQRARHGPPPPPTRHGDQRAQHGPPPPPARHGSPPPPPPVDDWVHVNNVHFLLHGQPFYVYGFDAYWLPDFAQDPMYRPNVTNFLERTKALGFNVFRTWAFKNSDTDPTAWQVGPRQYNSTAMEGLDFVISEAKRLGLKVVLPFGNNWDDYGGKSLYARWVYGPQAPADLFYSNEQVKSLYKDYIHMLLNRTNTFTGIKYRQESAIFSWELLNEPECQSDPSGYTLDAWTQEISSFIKSIDNRHLLSNGAEGFYMTFGRGRVNGRYEFDGIDFVRHNRNPNIDYATSHFYPTWMRIPGLVGRLDYARSWVAEHKQDAHNLLRKPVLFGEFGTGVPRSLREKLFFYYEIFQDVFAGPVPATGGCVWQLFGDNIPPASWEDGNQVRIGELEASPLRVNFP